MQVTSGVWEWGVRRASAAPHSTLPTPHSLFASPLRGREPSPLLTPLAPPGFYLGRVGPLPAPVLSIAFAISSRSSDVSSSVAPPIHPSTCAAERAPTIAAVSPGHARSQAIATAETVPPWRFAIGLSASRSDRFFSRRGDWKLLDVRRQSSGAIVLRRSGVNESVRIPACIGL